jgi:hypothetical protein
MADGFEGAPSGKEHRWKLMLLSAAAPSRLIWPCPARSFKRMEGREQAYGDPAASLLQMGKEDEKPVLLAVGGLGFYEHMRIGSVPGKFVRAARRPILVLPRAVPSRECGETVPSPRLRKRSVRRWTNLKQGSW